MKSLKNAITFKIIASYVFLGALAIFVSVFLYQQLKQTSPVNISEEKKVINTGVMISALYEVNSYASLSLQSLNKEDFTIYEHKNDSLIDGIESLQNEKIIGLDGKQLDTITDLLKLKKTNIEQLIALKITNNKDDALDAILNEFEILETSMGRMTLQNFIENPQELNKKQLQTVLDYTNYINSKKTNVSSKAVDTMLTSTREILKNVKTSSLKLREVLLEKENLLVRNDLDISLQLRTIITNLSLAIDKKQQLETELKNKTLNTSNRVIKIAGWLAIFLIVLFSYFIISDFFKSQRLKKSLLEAQQNTTNLLQSRERLIASVSHDLKTPLTTISGYTKLLDDTILDNKQKSYTNAINENAHYINHLAQDLLDFSKIEANKISIVKTPFNLNSLLEKILNGASVLHSNNKVTGTLKIDAELKELYFLNDALRIEQIVTNLISNAFKFTKAGEIVLKATIEKQKNNLRTVAITVTDTGIGIAPEKQKVIFDAFTQADDSVVQTYGGSGLGLTISKKLAEILKGTLTVNSELNSGSVFKFTIPLEVVAKPINENETSIKFKEGIIIDDDLGLLKLLKVLFQQLNIKTTCFSSFSELQNNTPDTFDFILTDMQMPNDSGLEILEKIKQGALKKHTKQPVFLMSGNLQFEDKHYLDKGFKGVIAKPFTIEALSDLLHISEKTISEKDKVVEIENTRNYKKFNFKLLDGFLSDTETIKEIVTIFITETKSNTQTIDQAIKTNNIVLLKKTTHKMKTMSSQLNATDVVNGLNELEKSSNLNSSPEKLLTTFKQLEIEINLLLEELTHYLNQ